MAFRIAARTDSNHAQIVKELRSLGCSVLNTHQLKGAFDILVGHKGENYAFEIKDPGKAKSQRKLTEKENRFHERWRGQISIIETTEDALKVINRPFQERLILQKK